MHLVGAILREIFTFSLKVKDAGEKLVRQTKYIGQTTFRLEFCSDSDHYGNTSFICSIVFSPRRKRFFPSNAIPKFDKQS